MASTWCLLGTEGEGITIYSVTGGEGLFWWPAEDATPGNILLKQAVERGERQETLMLPTGSHRGHPAVDHQNMDVPFHSLYQQSLGCGGAGCCEAGDIVSFHNRVIWSQWDGCYSTYETFKCNINLHGWNPWKSKRQVVPPLASDPHFCDLAYDGHKFDVQ